MVVNGGEWLYTQDMRIANNWKERQNANGALSMNRKGMAGVSVHVMACERPRAICAFAVLLGSTLSSNGALGISVFGG